MNNKRKTAISTLAIGAVLITAFAFNSNASLSGKIAPDLSSKPAQSAEVSTKAASENSLVATAESTGVKSEVKKNAVADNKQNTVAVKASQAATPTSVNSKAEKLVKAANQKSPAKASTTECDNNVVKNQTNNQQTNIKDLVSANLKNSNINSSNIKSLLDKILSQNTSASCVIQPAVKKPSGTTNTAGNTNKPAETTKPASNTNKPAATTKPTTGTSNSTGTANPSQTTTTGEYSAFQQKVLDLVNAERAKAGLKSLKMNAELSKVATLKSQDMAKNNYFDHTSPTYGSPFDMMKKFGISYRTAGENIAMGQTTPEQVMNGWMNSPGHRANILKASFTEIGIGIAKNSSGRLYWTQQFIG